ncbi:MAG: arylsulfatase [Planctomycetes bacterium]|nr:arylsulfatase [Planctomycetota bacterium]
MHRRRFLKTLGLGAAALAWPRIAPAAQGAAAATRGAPANAAADRPDIVIVIADDMGYSDLGCYGGEIATPHLDGLARRGLRFTRYHTENMCAPTRATLLTGRYWIRGFDAGNNATIPEALKAAGYRSCMAGKWHNTNDVGPARQAPLKRGFDRFFGTPIGCGSFFAPLMLTRDGEPAEHEWQEKKDFYYTDAISDNAAAYIKETPKDTPLFLYVAYTAAHWPLHALPEDIARYKGRYAGGWDKLREARLARMKELGVVRPDTPLSPRHPDVPAWDAEPNKAWQERRMEVYAAQVDRMDQGIGRILGALEARGRLQNTLILFTIDNGGCYVEYGANRKGDFLNETTRDGRPLVVGNRPDVMPGPEDTWQSYGYGWANASNTPLRLFKQFDHEGGTRVPLIAQWPAVIAKGGQITDQVAHVIDLLPTALDAAGVAYPETLGGRAIGLADGLSLVPIFRGEQRKGHDALFWEFAHGQAVRKGPWKLVRMDKKPWELYNMDADPAELSDLASAHPDRVKELEALWEAWNASGKTGGKKQK